MRLKIMIGAVMAAVMLMIAGCNQTGDTKENQQEENAAPTPVETGKVEKGSFSVERSVNGKAAPNQQTPVMLEQPGEITSLKVENGDKIEKDDLLATVKTPMGNENLYAKEAGIVSSLKVKEGEIQSNEDPLMVIIDLHKVFAEFSIAASIRDLLNKDDKVTIIIGKEEYKGKIKAMDLLPNDTGQYPVKAEIDNKDEKILPGMTATMQIKEVKAKDALIIPTESVMNDTEGNFVFLADGEIAKRVDIKIIETQTEKTAAEGDLQKDDMIITKGQHILKDGSKIEVKAGNEK